MPEPSITSVDPVTLAVARAICLTEFGDEEAYGPLRCCQVGGTEGCCLDTILPAARAAIAAYQNATKPEQPCVGTLEQHGHEHLQMPGLRP